MIQKLKWRFENMALYFFGIPSCIGGDLGLPLFTL